jgi:hypothetical protein
VLAIVLHGRLFLARTTLTQPDEIRQELKYQPVRKVTPPSTPSGTADT